ncbi:hypothetical protein F2P79_018684 [Pimephales promelas]|nr:hypothetical protein F2P79_018684 [Pimephales promelas]
MKGCSKSSPAPAGSCRQKTPRPLQARQSPPLDTPVYTTRVYPGNIVKITHDFPRLPLGRPKSPWLPQRRLVPNRNQHPRTEADRACPLNHQALAQQIPHATQVKSDEAAGSVHMLRGWREPAWRGQSPNTQDSAQSPPWVFPAKLWQHV